jgi:hypothetical protein
VMGESKMGLIREVIALCIGCLGMLCLVVGIPLATFFEWYLGLDMGGWFFLCLVSGIAGLFVCFALESASHDEFPSNY